MTCLFLKILQDPSEVQEARFRLEFIEKRILLTGFAKAPMPPRRKDNFPVLTVDAIVRKNSDEILIEQRGIEPYKGSLAFPGGHVEYGETVEHAALRELWEECSVEAKLRSILGVYSDPKRDPRGQRVSVVFIADYERGIAKAGDDARSVSWMKIHDLRRHGGLLAFDHKLILQDYLTWRNSVKNKKCDYTFWSSKKRWRNKKSVMCFA